MKSDDDDDPTLGMPVAEFIIELLKVPSLHFDDSVKEFRRKYFDRPVAQVCDHDGATTATNLGGDEIATFPTSDIESRRALGKNYVIV